MLTDYCEVFKKAVSENIEKQFNECSLCYIYLGEDISLEENYKFSLH